MTVTQDPKEARTMGKAEPMYLTTAELAERWRMSENTLRNWRFKGIGPRYFKPAGDNGKTFYRLTDVHAWEESHMTETEGGDP